MPGTFGFFFTARFGGNKLISCWAQASHLASFPSPFLWSARAAERAMGEKERAPHWNTTAAMAALAEKATCAVQQECFAFRTPERCFFLPTRKLQLAFVGISRPRSNVSQRGSERLLPWPRTVTSGNNPHVSLLFFAPRFFLLQFFVFPVAAHRLGKNAEEERESFFFFTQRSAKIPSPSIVTSQFHIYCYPSEPCGVKRMVLAFRGGGLAHTSTSQCVALFFLIEQRELKSFCDIVGSDWLHFAFSKQGRDMLQLGRD